MQIIYLETRTRKPQLETETRAKKGREAITEPVGDQVMDTGSWDPVLKAVLGVL